VGSELLAGASHGFDNGIEVDLLPLAILIYRGPLESTATVARP